MACLVSESARGSAWIGDAEDLELVLRLAADPITVQDASGRLVYANEAAARQVGFASADKFLAAPAAEIVGRYELLDEFGRPMPFDELPGRRAIRGEAEPAAIVGFRVRGERKPRWSIVQATPVVRDGTVRFVINAFQDITRLKETEDRQRILADSGAILADSGEYQPTLQSLAELAVPRLADWCVVDVVETSGLRRVAIAHPNPAKRALAEEMQRRYPTDPSRSGGVADVISSGRTHIVETVTDEMLERAAHGPDHFERLRALDLRSAAIVPLVARGQVLGAITLAGGESGHVYRDTDRPFLEELARRAALAVDNARLLHEANEAIRLRDDFVAMASHDMRTPLQAILANLQLAARRLARLVASEGEDETARQLRENLEQAERTTDRLTVLVGDLMDVAMLRSGHSLPIDLSEVSLRGLITTVAGEHQAGSEQHDIRLEDGPDVVVTTDVARVGRVLDNLLENAVKYSPEGGEVVVSVRAMSSQAVIDVRDEGIGVPDGETELIFEPYRRASNVATMRGIGLGLSGARAVVRQLGGDLRVTDREGKGSTFTVILPLA
jgi:signal transduction histidine kinase